MSFQIKMNGSAWGEIISSLLKVARGTEDLPLDVNVIATADNRARFYTRNFNNLQVEHTVIDTGLVTVEVSEPTKLVFNSENLQPVIQKAKKRDIELTFHEHTFTVRVQDSPSFSTPTTLDLRLVNETEFTDPIETSGFNTVGTIDREALLNNLEMFETVSKVAEFEVQDQTLDISVTDKVQGEGSVSASLDNCGITSLSGEYKIRPLKDFLNQVGAESVDVLMKADASLMLRSSAPGRTSEMMLSPQIESM